MPASPAGRRGAGGGSRTLTPPWGQLILSQPRIANFATPARRRIPLGVRRYAPGVNVSTGKRSGPLPRNASRNVVNAFSLYALQIASRPWPVPPSGDVHAVSAILLPSVGYGVPSMPLGLDE